MTTAEMVDDLGVKMALTFRGATRLMHRSTVTRTVSQQLMRVKRVCGIPGGHEKKVKRQTQTDR